MKDKFKTTKGLLTPYALKCGYIEQTQIKKKRVTLWFDCGLYHVRGHDFNDSKRLFWNIYEKLTTARKAYKKAINHNLRGTK